MDHLPIIDWNQAVKLAGNKTDLAEEMFQMLLTSLPSDIASIQALHSAKNYSELLQHVHKLHGVLCYCGLPRLKLVIENLEKDLKHNTLSTIPQLLLQLDAEVSLLLSYS